MPSTSAMTPKEEIAGAFAALYGDNAAAAAYATYESEQEGREQADAADAAPAADEGEDEGKEVGVGGDEGAPADVLSKGSRPSTPSPAPEARAARWPPTRRTPAPAPAEPPPTPAPPRRPS